MLDERSQVLPEGRRRRARREERLAVFGEVEQALVTRGGEERFFAKPDAPFQFIAVDDIGEFAAAVFAEPAAHTGRTFEIAGDTLTLGQVASKIAAATSRPVSYSQFPPEVRGLDATVGRLVELVDGGLTGTADIAALRRLHPGVLSFDAWLAKDGIRKIEQLRAR